MRVGTYREGIIMKVHYKFQPLTSTERASMELLLLEEIEKQTWYVIVGSEFGRLELFLCLQ